jgi:dipeptide/tripeptide permease
MGTTVTLFMLALHIGTGLGPIALGAIADRLGLASAFYATSASMVAGLLLFAFLVRRTPVKKT